MAQDLARRIAANAPLSNYIMIQAIARIEDMSKADGLFTESLCAAITQTSPDAHRGAPGLPCRNATRTSGEPMPDDAAKGHRRRDRISDATLRGLVGYNMKRAFMVIGADLARTLEPFELRMLTFTALTLVADNPGLSQSQLAEAMQVERPNLVVIVDELETRGLITRDRVPTDRRTYALRITAEGARLLANATRAVARARKPDHGRADRRRGGRADRDPQPDRDIRDREELMDPSKYRPHNSRARHPRRWHPALHARATRLARRPAPPATGCTTGPSERR